MQVSNNPTTFVQCNELHVIIKMEKLSGLFLLLYSLLFSSSSSSPVKILEKRHIMKENKAQYVKRERDLMSNLDHPFFVKLYFTFQDDEKLCILKKVQFVKACCILITYQMYLSFTICVL